MRGWHWWVACLGITAFSIASIGSALSVGTVGLQYLHYDEVLHFYVENGIPYVNQPEQPALNVGATITAEYATSLDFSVDGKTLAVGYGGIARLWSLPTGTLQHEFFVNVAAYRTPNADRRPVLGTRVRYSPDGRYLAISAWDEVQIYEHNTLIHHCKGFIDAPFAWSPDSRLIAGSNDSGDLIICDVQMEHIDQYTGFLTTAAEWSPDGKYILVLSDSFDYTSYLRLFNVQTKQVEQTSSGKSSVDWNPDSRSTSQTRLKIWLFGVFQQALRALICRTAETPSPGIRAGGELLHTSART